MKKIVTLILTTILIVLVQSGCTISEIDIVENYASFTVYNNTVTDLNLVFGNSADQTIIGTINSLSKDNVVHITEIPTNRYLEIWCTYPGYNDLETPLFSSVTAAEFSFLFLPGEDYTLELNRGIYKLVQDSIEVDFGVLGQTIVPINLDSELTATNITPINFSIDFGFPVDTMNVENIIVTNGEMKEYYLTNDQELTITLEAYSEGNVSLFIPEETVSESHYIINKEYEIEFIYDVTIPEVTLSPISPAITYESPVQFEMLISEPISDFISSSQLSSSNGFVYEIIQDETYPETNGLRYVVNVVPDNSAEIAISIQDDAITDFAGNLNEFTVSQGSVNFKATGQVREIVSTSDAQWLFAIDYDNDRLIRLDSVNQKIDTMIDLPYTEPISIKYSYTDDMLYIVFASTDIISRYNVGSAIWETEFDIDPTSTSRQSKELEISPTNRKLYCLTNSSASFEGNFLILDMDNGNEIARGTVSGSTMTVGDSSGAIYLGDKGFSPATIYKYSQSDTSVIELQEYITSGGNGQFIILSEDELHLVFACGGGNGGGYSMYDFDPSDISQHNGEWVTGAYPEYGAFSQDSQYFYGYGDGLTVFTMNYLKIRTLDIPNDDPVFTLTNNGNTLVVFSYDRYWDREHKFYFFTDIKS